MKETWNLPSPNIPVTARSCERDVHLESLVKTEVFFFGKNMFYRVVKEGGSKGRGVP